MTRLLLLALLVPAAALADNQCETVRVELVPTDSLQIVVWVEDAAGHYVDTLYVTRKIGSYGIGNRPGRFDLNSGPPPNGATGNDSMFPYGRRITTFPVWSHRHGKTFPRVVPQDGDDNTISKAFDQSSGEPAKPFCRPVLPPMDPGSDPATCGGCKDRQMWDTGTCATLVFSDKGTFSATETSLYPPRADLTRNSATDSPSVAMYRATNPFDAVSQATPLPGASVVVPWATPSNLPAGNYVVWVELAREFDFNASYNCTFDTTAKAWNCTFPLPDIPFGNYGVPYRGQPSVVYKAPFTVGATESIATSLDYVGYGDPTGADGAIRPPDATITTDTPGSGALRLELVSDGSAMYRLKVDAKPVLDSIPPATPDQLTATAITSSSAMLSFLAPGDDGVIGRASGYDIRIRANDPLTPDNFADSMHITATVSPLDAGGIQQLALDGLLPDTDYWVGVQAFDKCHNLSPIAITEVTTTDRTSGSVNACFVATAAYGSVMANDVELLRHFRDSLLESTVLGELAVESYYTFGPAVAGVVGESDLLRATARQALAPLVARIRTLSF